jgi:opacity protein-like surface antigen
MTRIAAGCLACVSFAARAAAEHAPPPAIVLGPAPAPELPTLEYARRPFELSAEVLLGFPSCAGDSSCSLSAGPGLGVSGLWRVSPHFAFGGTGNVLGFAFRSANASGLREASASGGFCGLLGRVYFVDHGRVEPYLELGLGSGWLAASERQADAAYQDSAWGVALRAGGGLEFNLSRQVRLGPAFAWMRLDGKRERQCAGSGCIDASEASFGRAAGFSSVSVRVSILLGPAL